MQHENYLGVILNDTLMYNIDRDDIISYLEFLFLNRTDIIESEYIDKKRTISVGWIYLH